MTRDGSDPRRSLDRRSLLRGLGATGAAGAFAGCLGTVEREYEAKPVGLDEQSAADHGFEPRPRVEKQETTVSKNTGANTVRADLTGYIYRYEYAGEDVAEVDDGGSDPGGSTPGGETSTPGDGTSTPGDGTPPDDDDDDGDPRVTTRLTDRPATPTPTPEEEGCPAGAAPRDDALNVVSAPNPKFAGQSLNPGASKSIETLIEEETEAFELACDCTIGSPGKIEVESTSDPTKYRTERGDTARIVVQIDPTGDDPLDLPETVELFGEQRRVGYFAFSADAEAEGFGLHAVLIVTAKATTNVGGESPETVITSYVARRCLPALDEPVPVVGPDGLFTRAQVATAADRLTSTCPDVGGGVPEPGTATPTATPTETPTGPPRTQPELVAAAAVERGIQNVVVAMPQGGSLEGQQSRLIKTLGKKFDAAFRARGGSTETVAFRPDGGDLGGAAEAALNAGAGGMFVLGHPQALDTAAGFLQRVVPTLAESAPDTQLFLSNNLLTAQFTSRLDPLAEQGMTTLPPITGAHGSSLGEAPVMASVVNSGPAFGVVAPAGIAASLNPQEMVKKIKNGEIDIEELSGKLKRLKGLLDEIKGRIDQLRKLYELVNTLLDNESLTPAEQAQKMAKLLKLGSSLIPVPEGVDSFIEFYTKALTAIADAISVISDKIHEGDKRSGSVAHPGAWPGGWDMYNYFAEGEFDESVCAWIKENEDMLEALVGGDPYKTKKQSLAGFDYLWPDTKDVAHTKQWLKDHEQEVKDLLYDGANCCA